MTSIRQVYQIINKLDTPGVQGYHVDSKYYDPLKMKEERILQTSKDKIAGAKPAHTSKKTTFIDQIQKKQAKMPGPCSYQPKEIIAKSKTQQLVTPSKRQTIFDQMEHVQKKYNYPGAATYGKVEVAADLTKLKGNISKAENSNYLDSSMRGSLQSPGVGNYNAYHPVFDKRGNKWTGSDDKKEKSKDKTSKSLKLPPVGTYSPLPVAYQLFDNQLTGSKKRYKPYFNKQQRFKRSKDKPLPFYNILSEWGIKDKRTKKDILERISLPSAHRSVYH